MYQKEILKKQEDENEKENTKFCALSGHVGFLSGGCTVQKYQP